MRWRQEPVLDRETLNGIIGKLMAMNAKVQQLVDALLEGGEDGEEEADT